MLGQYEYNALHWRGVKRARTPGAGSLDEMRLMYYSANWQLLEERIDRSWTSGFTEDERAQSFWGKRYIDDSVARRRDRDANGSWDNSFFYVTDAQFSTVAIALPNGGIVERITYDSYGKARHHFGADVTGDGATTSADGTAIQNAYGESIGDAGYEAELDLDRDGDIDSDDYNAGIALSGGVTQSALASGMVSFVSTGSGGSTRHGPDNPIAWDGYVFNAETGQYLVRFRWYDPVLGRWLERDPFGFVDGVSLYAYVGANPPRRRDPLGAFRIDDPEMRPYRKRTGEMRYGYIYDENGLVIDYVPDPANPSAPAEPCCKLDLVYDFVKPDLFGRAVQMPWRTKYVDSMADVLADMKARTAGGCCVKRLTLTGHSGKEGALHLGTSTIDAEYLESLKETVADPNLPEEKKRVTDPGHYELLDLKPYLCKDSVIDFAQCDTTGGAVGLQLRNYLEELFGPGVKIILYEGDVVWLFGWPCEIRFPLGVGTKKY